MSGARAAGAETETLHLIDEEPRYCVHCGHGCFVDGQCAQEAAATLRSGRLDAADAMVICAPVYCWQPTGLTVAFLDKARMSTAPWNRGQQHGRLALGIAVAGGTGSGVFPALQSLYAWLCLWKFRPLDPLPVTRFNLPQVLAEAEAYGRALAGGSAQPFESTWEQMLTYDCLPYMDYGRIDEFRWLAGQIAGGLRTRAGDTESSDESIAEIERLLEAARACVARGDLEGEAQHCIRAYQIGAKAW
jgi:hypothetical protein